MGYKSRQLSGDSGFGDDFSPNASIQHAYVKVAKEGLSPFLSFAKSNGKQLLKAVAKPEQIEAIQRLNGKSNGWEKDLEDINSVISSLQKIIFDYGSNKREKELRRAMAKNLLVQTTEMNPDNQKHADSGLKEWFLKFVVGRDKDLGAFFEEKNKAFQGASAKLESLKKQIKKLELEVPKIENILVRSGESLDETLNHLIQQQETDFKEVSIFLYPKSYDMEFGKDIGDGNSYSSAVIESPLFAINEDIREAIKRGLDEYEKKHKDYKSRKSYGAWVSILGLIESKPHRYYYQGFRQNSVLRACITALSLIFMLH